MAQEELHHRALAARDTECLHLLRQLRRHVGLETLQGADHRLAAVEFRGARVRAELALAGYPHDDDAGEDAEHQLSRDHGAEVAEAVAGFVAQDDPVHEVADDARQEDDERVDHALDERQRDHVAVGDVRNFMRQDSFDLFLRHTAQQPGADCHQRRVAPRAGRERVHVGRVVNSHFGRLDAGFPCLSFDRRDEPGLGRVLRLGDDSGTRGALGHPLRHGEGDKRAAETEHQREHQQRLVIDADLLFVEIRVHAQQPQHDAEHQQDCQVRGDEQHYAFEHSRYSVYETGCRNDGVCGTFKASATYSQACGTAARRRGALR